MKNYVILTLVVLPLVSGSVILAIIDPSTRDAFTDLTKVAVGALIGLLIPTPGQRS
ncbi:hypothetical protein [Dulcicalothrix desertica]|uniref:hypothetical protein n=1 Tax=Dulcicalothrix desertica TaxID=32056 RepID=UPI001199231F|nr:hypothetical protein [Dulcicalothrix desertica]TWH61394.1 hypothetical protein CAL7102_00954 [Dulcicalothrix desertica PCC 7102]